MWFQLPMRAHVLLCAPHVSSRRLWARTVREIMDSVPNALRIEYLRSTARSQDEQRTGLLQSSTRTRRLNTPGTNLHDTSTRDMPRFPKHTSSVQAIQVILAAAHSSDHPIHYANQQGVRHRPKPCTGRVTRGCASATRSIRCHAVCSDAGTTTGAYFAFDIIPEL